MLRPSFASWLGLLLAVTLVTGSGAAPGTQPAPLGDVLDTPATLSDFAKRGVVSGIARRGDRLIAVGPRGLILLSVDGARNWKQLASPVSADLVSVKFADASTAWAVGHDAVALRSTDGGDTWEQVLDGRSVLKLLQAGYGERAKAGDAAARAVLRELERSAEQSAVPTVLPAPFLDAWFGQGGEGYLIGAFGLLLHTADGGKTWTPWIERTDNDSRFHLYAIAAEGAQRYIVGEQGLLMRLDRERGRFVKIETPYKGTFFGVDAKPGRLLAYGLRGNAYVSRDEGRQWDKIETGIDANIVAAVNASDERLLLVSQAGHVLAVPRDSLKAQPVQVPYTTEVLGAVAAGPRGLALAQINGVRVVELAGESLQ